MILTNKEVLKLLRIGLEDETDLPVPSEKNEMPSDETLHQMDEAMRNWPRVSAAIDLGPSHFCEVLTEGAECGKPATHAYPAQGGGFMALCSEHAKQHPEAWPIKEI